MDRAEALVREMEESGIDAPIDIYHTMMDGYTISGNENKCLVVFDRLKVYVIIVFLAWGGGPVHACIHTYLCLSACVFAVVIFCNWIFFFSFWLFFICLKELFFQNKMKAKLKQ